MKNRELNLFIVAENALVVVDLKRYLQDKFGSSVHISPFYDKKSCLKKVNKKTNAVVLDYFLEGQKSDKVIRTIKNINPKTEGIVYSSTEEVAAYVAALLRGERNKIQNNEKILA
jgi:DNA-binding NtrC family response regulator